MAEPVPWQLTKTQFPKSSKRETYVRDPYYFNVTSVSQGTNNPVVVIPLMGQAAAGAPPPTTFRTVASVEITSTGSVGCDYGVNVHQPV